MSLYLCYLFDLNDEALLLPSLKNIIIVEKSIESEFVNLKVGNVMDVVRSCLIVTAHKSQNLMK